MTVLTRVFLMAALLVSGGTSAHCAEKHLFYLQGCCVMETNGAKAKAYETIVQELKRSGFNVHFELQTADVYDKPPGAQAHAVKTAHQIKALLAQGTPPEQIVVAGYSLGARIALIVAGLVDNPKVNYALLAGCTNRPASPLAIDYAKVKGRFLAIIDAQDEKKFGSCTGMLPQGTVYQEIVLDSGDGHAVFQRTNDKYLKLWKDPLVAWANKQ